MKPLRRGWRRLLASLSGSIGFNAEGELHDEVASHIEMQVEDNLRSGMNLTEARRAAILKFGGVEVTKENVRDQRGLPVLESFFTECRYALRGLRKNPGFTAVAIVTLAVGIGACTAVFSVASQVLLRPAGIVNPERVVTVRTTYGKLNLEFIGGSTRTMKDLQESSQIFSYAAAAASRDANFTPNGGAAQRIRATSVTHQWFDVFGAKPYWGRTFSRDEDAPNQNRVAVLSHAAWRQWFGSDPQIVGRTVELNQLPMRVVGVMGPEFRQPALTEVWTPLGLPPAAFTESARFSEQAQVVARTRNGVSAEAANNWLGILTRRVGEMPESGARQRDARWSIAAVPYVNAVAGESRDVLLGLLAVTGLVLLIACANIAGLLLARASSRGREWALRAALGATHMQLVRSISAESILLAASGGAAGIAVALVGVRALLAMAPADVAATLSPSLDPFALGFCALAACAAAVLCGLAPAWHVFRTGGENQLGGEGRATTAGSRRQLSRSLIVVAETGIAFLLLVAGGLFFQSFARLQSVDPGFDPRGVMTAGVSAPPQMFPKGDAERIVFYQALVEQLKNRPGVASAALGLPVPFIGGVSAGSFEIEGRAASPGGLVTHGNQRVVAPGYFETLGIPLKSGRFFTNQDVATGEPVIIIDETLARLFWPGEDPVGKRIKKGEWSRIVGVVGHVMHTSLLPDNGEGTYYQSLYQRPAPLAQIVVKARGDANQMTGAIRAAVREADPRIAAGQFLSLEDAVARSLAPRRFGMLLIGFFAATGLFLAALGLYGVISYSVSQRQREIGIRMAMGAERQTVVAMILRQALYLTGFGAAIGLLASALGSKLIQTQLFAVGALDPVTFVTAAAILSASAVLAGSLPALRATRIDPAVALRPE